MRCLHARINHHIRARGTPADKDDCYGRANKHLLLRAAVDGNPLVVTPSASKYAPCVHERPLIAVAPDTGLFLPRVTFFGHARVPHVVHTGENSQNTDKHTEHLRSKAAAKHNNISRYLT